MNGPGQLLQQAFREHMEHFGEDFHVGGETRRGVYSDHKELRKSVSCRESFHCGLVTLLSDGQPKKTLGLCRQDRKLWLECTSTSMPLSYRSHKTPVVYFQETAVPRF
jgi:hypothetical protein